MLGKSGMVRRAFGGFYYREDMADHGFAPGTLSLEDCVAQNGGRTWLTSPPSC